MSTESSTRARRPGPRAAWARSPPRSSSWWSASASSTCSGTGDGPMHPADRRRGTVVTALIAGLGLTLGPPARAGAAGYQTITFRTVPAVAGGRIAEGDRGVRTDRRGRGTLTGRRTGPRFRAIQPPRVLPTPLTLGRVVRSAGSCARGRPLGLALSARSPLRFVAPGGRPFPGRRVGSVGLRSDTGAHVAVRGAVTPPLRARRVVLTRDGPRSRPMAYA